MPKPDIYLTNLPSLVTPAFKPASGIGRGWLPVEYQAQEISGTALSTGYDSGARPLTLNLNLTGTYTLYLALGQHDGIRVWLDGEPGFRELICEHGGHRVQEARLHTANLTGKRLHIAPIPAHPYRKQDAATFLAYIRAVPEKPHKNARNLVGTNDGFSWIALDSMEDVYDVSKTFTPFRDSDFFRVLWCPLGADVTGCHQTTVGNTIPLTTDHAYRRCDRLYASTIKRILGQGGDILAQAASSAKDVGVELSFYIRPEAFFCQFPHDKSFASNFLLQNPGLRCVDEFGRPVMRMSYAYPQVQDHMLAYIAELLTYKPHDICLAFNRSLPMMIAEAPVIEAFKKRFRRSPVLPSEIDGRHMTQIRHEILEGFLLRLRSLLDKHKVSLSCIVYPNIESHRILGFNLAQAAKKGIFDSICVTANCTKDPFWARLKRQTGVKIYPGTYSLHEPGQAPPDLWDHKWQASAMLSLLDSPLDGGFFWDVETLQGNPYNWHVYRQAGTRSFLQQILENHPSSQVRFKNMTHVQGIHMDRYSPWASY